MQVKSALKVSLSKYGVGVGVGKDVGVGVGWGVAVITTTVFSSIVSFVWISFTTDGFSVGVGVDLILLLGIIGVVASVGVGDVSVSAPAISPSLFCVWIFGVELVVCFSSIFAPLFTIKL